MAVSLRPTHQLTAFGILLILLWATSANYNNNLGFILTYLATAIAAVSPLWTRNQIRGLSLEPRIPEPVFAGDDACLKVQVHNPTSQPKYQLRLQGEKGKPVEFTLGPREHRSITVPLGNHKRGRLLLEALILESSFPLGLFRVRHTIPVTLELWIYPQPARHPPPLPRTSIPQEREETDFAGFRPYQPGDSLRQIHWKGVAKGQGLQTRMFQNSADNSGEPMLNWNLLPPADVEVRLSWICSWLLDVEKRGCRYGLRLPNRSLAPDQGPLHLHACLKLLAAFPNESPSR